MTKKTRRPVFLKDYYYHIYNRGASQRTIFREDENYLFCIGRIKKYSLELEISVIAYCLMPNHYHLMVRQDGDSPAGLLPQRVFNSYTKAYNKRYEVSGTLFEGPYKVNAVETESQLRHLPRYIHCNPVKHGFVEIPEDWEFSNYRDWIGRRKGTLVDFEFIRTFYGNAVSYMEIIGEYLVEEDW